MAFDLDPFDDILPDHATKIARAGGKFQPKAKPRPRNGSSVSVTSTQLVQSVDVAENGSIDLYSSLSTSETLRAKEPLGNCKNSLSGVHSSNDNKSSELVNPSLEYVAVRESVGPIDGLQSHFVMPESNGDWHSGFAKSTKENADIFSGLESLNEFLSQSTTGTVSTGNRSPPKIDMDPELKNDSSTSCTVNAEAEGSVLPSKMETSNVSDTINTEKVLGIPTVSPFDISTSRASNDALADTCYELSMGLAPLSCEEAAVSNSGGDFYVDDPRLETEFQDMDVFPCLDNLDIMSELTTSSGRQAGKFRPKPKVHNDKEKSRASISDQEAVECVSCPQDSQSVRSEVECIGEVLIPAFPPDQLLDFSSSRFGAIPSDPTSELTMNEEPTNLMGTSQSDAAIPGPQMEAVPEMPGEVAIRRKRKTHRISDHSLEHQNVSTSVQENEVCRSARQLRKRNNAFELVDESEDEGHDDADFPAERPSVSVVDEDDDNDTEYHVENETQNKRVPRKSRKPVAEKDKPVRKRNKVNGVTVQSTKAPPKKFSHSTRRNKRRVDKVLLETPEDEIDLQKLRIRDLILLAEHRERMNKEATTSEIPLNNHSASNSFAHYNEDGTFASESGGISGVEQTIPTQEGSTYYNYQSFMDKTPISRWSKQETELFYEAVRQFGTDLSMIQQLFPDRTRRQVKLKYKKEERQYPMRLREALTNRAKDHSHFQLVIERLQQVAAEGKQNNGEDSYGLTGEQEEVVSKSEQAEEKVEKSYDSEADFYFKYKSGF